MAQQNGNSDCAGSPASVANTPSERERQLREFSDNIPESIAYIDSTRRYKFANKAFLALHGLSHGDVIGKRANDVLGADAARIAEQPVMEAFNGKTGIYERLVTLASGEKRWRRVHAAPDLTSAGVVQGVYLFGIDIHQSKQSEIAVLASEATMHSALDSLPFPIGYIDRDFVMRAVNKAGAIFFGRVPQQVEGQPASKVMSATQFTKFKHVGDRVLAGNTIMAERKLSYGGAEPKWHLLRSTPREDANGKIIGFYTSAIDIDERKRNELELKHANWLLSSHFENSPLAAIEWTQGLRVHRWSEGAERLFGWRADQVAEKHYEEWQFIHEDDRFYVKELAAQLGTGSVARNTALTRVYRSDGQTIWVEWHNSALRDEAGAVVSILSLGQDVTTRLAAEERLIHQATHDGLTGLPNRSLLQDRLRQAMLRAKRTGARVATLFIDLDRFKEINDTYGHRAGDNLLREMTARFSNSIRETDLLVRLSGDEFMVMIEDVTDTATPATVAKKILGCAREAVIVDSHAVHISASIGISLYPDDADDVETLISHADMAMYHAKELGKNGYQTFSSDLADKAMSNRLLEESLREAIVRNELVLHYQPKVDMASGNMIGAEALIRWQHPTRGLLGPHMFLHLAETGELVHAVGNWVLNTAFAQVRQWENEGLVNVKVAVNLSAGQFSAIKLADHIKTLLDANGCSPGAIEVEVTETSMLQDPELVGRTLAALRVFGVSVAIDDFGTGYSSLSHLKRFPIDTMKIDRSFISDVLTSSDDAAIVTAVIALSKALNIKVVAEGVETEGQRQFLSERGCDTYQGYLFNKPMPADKFAEIFRAQMARQRS